MTRKERKIGSSLREVRVNEGSSYRESTVYLVKALLPIPVLCSADHIQKVLNGNKRAWKR